MRPDCVFEGIRRSEIHMPRLGRDGQPPAASPQQGRCAKSRSGTEHELRPERLRSRCADLARPVRPEMGQGDRLRLEIIEQQSAFQIEGVGQLRAVDRPVGIGQPHPGAVDRSRRADQKGTGADLRAFLHNLDRRKEAGMGSRWRVAESPNAVAGPRDRADADVGAADIADQQRVGKIQAALRRSPRRANDFTRDRRA